MAATSRPGGWPGRVPWWTARGRRQRRSQMDGRHPGHPRGTEAGLQADSPCITSLTSASPVGPSGACTIGAHALTAPPPRPPRRSPGRGPRRPPRGSGPRSPATSGCRLSRVSTALSWPRRFCTTLTLSSWRMSRLACSGAGRGTSLRRRARLRPPRVARCRRTGSAAAAASQGGEHQRRWSPLRVRLACRIQDLHPSGGEHRQVGRQRVDDDLGERHRPEEAGVFGGAVYGSPPGSSTSWRSTRSIRGRKSIASTSTAKASPWRRPVPAASMTSAR